MRTQSAPNRLGVMPACIDDTAGISGPNTLEMTTSIKFATLLAIA